MKKRLAAFIIAALTATALASCGRTSSAASSGSSDTQTTRHHQEGDHHEKETTTHFSHRDTDHNNRHGLR